MKSFAVRGVGGLVLIVLMHACAEDETRRGADRDSGAASDTEEPGRTESDSDAPNVDGTEVEVEVEGSSGETDGAPTPPPSDTEEQRQ